MDGLQQAIGNLQATLTELDRRRGLVADAIASVQRLTGETMPAPAKKARKASPKTDGKTPTSRVTVPAGHAEPIIEALRKNSPQRPGELKQISRLSGYAFKALLMQMERAGTIVREGTGRGAIVRLPGKSPAKEVP